MKRAKLQLLGQMIRVFDVETYQTIKNYLNISLDDIKAELRHNGYELRQEDNPNFTL